MDRLASLPEFSHRTGNNLRQKPGFGRFMTIPARVQGGFLLIERKEKRLMEERR
jgi:hypothetical protein